MTWKRLMRMCITQFIRIQACTQKAKGICFYFLEHDAVVKYISAAAKSDQITEVSQIKIKNYTSVLQKRDNTSKGLFKIHVEFRY